jgi:class 3 adenylate cyclase/tetratricopeptide (TPR) repeat protein
MSVVCPSCGQENPNGFRFCGACGAALAEPPAAREERKVVTVLFCDLVGSTARADRADPEDVRAFLSRYHEGVRAELERFGGTVEKFIGDAVMAVFGAPTVHEDDPERAVRAALAIRDWATDEQTLEVRIGITTGEALVSLDAAPSTGEAMASGDVVNTAARIQTGAPVNGILVDRTTYRATRDVIRFEERDAIEAKGKTDAVQVWEAVEARSRLGVDVVRTAGTELVGRTRELDILRDALARVREERQPQLVSLVGVPGIGKSRLVYELLRVVEDDPQIIFWRQGRSLPYGEGISYWALAEIVKAHAGILDTDTAPAAEAKLHDAVSGVLDETESAWVETNLRPLIGLGDELELGGDRRAEAFAAWRRLFEAMAERSPLVLVFEDLQWADEGMLDFVDHLVEWAGGVPILVVAAARPELLARRPGWGGGKANAATISLAPLSDEETARLMGVLLGRAVLPAETQQRLLARVGGNPLYAEQYVRMLAESGPSDELALPETIQGIIAARLDALAPEEKELLQDAAVIGKVFWVGALGAFGERERWEVEQRLHALERRELVRRQRRAAVAGESEFAFVHLLVRDVAYGQIPRAARADKHRCAAEWIEGLSQDRSEDRAELLAHHYSSAITYATAAGHDTSELAERARLALRDAADRSASLFAFADAARHYAAALELWPEDDPERGKVLLALGTARNHSEGGGREILEEARERLMASGDLDLAGAAEIVLADVCWHEGDLDRSAMHQRQAAELVAGTPTSKAKAFVVANLSRFLMLSGDSAEAIRVGREALAMAEQLNLDGLRAHTLNNIGSARIRLGDLDGIGDLEESIAIAEVADPVEATRSYGNLASTLAERGDISRHAELNGNALAIVERLGLADAIRWFRSAQLESGYWSGRWDDVIRVANELIAEVEAGSSFYLESMWRTLRGRIHLARGALDDAVDDATNALELVRRGADPQLRDPVLVFAARALLEVGRRSEADAAVRELDLVENAQQALMLSAASIDLPFVLLELGRADDLADAASRVTSTTSWVDAALACVRGEFVQAADLYHEIGSLVDEAQARLGAADRLVSSGRRAEADVELQKALPFWRSVGATRYVRKGEALLAASA